MNRTALCIQMLQLLNSHKKLSVSELASHLETNPRNIIEFKKELETAGYYIKTTTGKFGGYELVNKSLMPAIKLTDEEKSSILAGSEYLNARNDFINKKEYNLALSKIMSNQPRPTIREFSVFNHFPLAMNIEEIEKRYNILTEAIDNNLQVKILYNSLENENKEHLINPYKLFLYNNAWFVLAYDNIKEKVLYFKLNRVSLLEKTQKTFRIPLTYKENDYLDEFGLKNNGEWFNIELELCGIAVQLIKERIYGREQKIIDMENGKSLLQVKMQNKEDIVSFVLGLKTDCKVISPKWLFDKIIGTSNNILELYQGDKK